MTILPEPSLKSETLPPIVPTLVVFLSSMSLKTLERGAVHRRAAEFSTHLPTALPRSTPGFDRVCLRSKDERVGSEHNFFRSLYAIGPVMRAEGGPSASSRRGSERGVDETQAFNAVLDGGEV